MKKLSLYVFLFLMLCNSANSKSMWAISTDWSCTIKLHTIIKTDGTVVAINTLKNTTTYDFKNSKVISTFDDGRSSVGNIVEKYYVDNKVYVNESIIVIDWESMGKYTSIVGERNNIFWESKTSGFSDPDKELWTSHYQCYPTN